MADGSVVIGISLDSEGFAESAAALENEIAAIGTDFSAVLAEHFGGESLSARMNEAMSMMASGLAGGAPLVTDAINRVSADLRGAVLGFGWQNLGGEIVSGIAAGVRAASGELVSAIRSVSAAAVSAAKNYYQIASPSALMREEVGVMISRGIAEGILDGSSSVAAALAAVSSVRPGSGAYTDSRTLNQTITLRDTDSSPYRTARRLRRESEAALR